MDSDNKTLIPHPDDFIEVHATLKFRAKVNPEATDPAPVVWTDVGIELSAAHAADFLEDVVRATRERRLYGFMLQYSAEGQADDWLKGTVEDFRFPHDS